MKKEIFNIAKLMGQSVERELVYVHGKPYIFCNQDLRVHGRTIEAIYIFLWLKRNNLSSLSTNEIANFYKSNKIFQNSLGGWENDIAVVRWSGTTVFFLDILSEIILYYNDLLDEDFKNLLLSDFKKGVNFLLNHFNITNAVANYLFAYLYILIRAEKIIKNHNYKNVINSCVQKIYSFIDNDYLIWGEGHYNTLESEQGYKAIDIIYNIDESIYYLYKILKVDNQVFSIKLFYKILLAHIHFLLMDGGIDGACGTRSYKWTYWGGRTAHGAESIFLELSKYSDVAKQWLTNHLLLLKKCLKNGLLLGGRDYALCDATPCIQHTIFKTISLIDSLSLDCEEFNNVFDGKIFNRDIVFKKYFHTVGIFLYKNENWHISYKFSDYIYWGVNYSSCLPAFIWNIKYGPLFSFSINDSLPPEPYNSQHQVLWKILEGTLRLESLDGNFSSNDSIMISFRQGIISKKEYIYTKGMLLKNNDYTYSCLVFIQKDFIQLFIKCNKRMNLLFPVIIGNNKVTSTHKDIFLKTVDTICQISLVSKNEFTSLGKGINYSPGFVINSFKCMCEDSFKTHILIKISDQ